MTLHALDLRGRAVLVVGEGRGAAERCRDLVAEGARPRLVASEIDAELQAALAELPSVVARPGAVVPGDLDDVWLVCVTSADALPADAPLLQWCDARRIWCEVAAAPEGVAGPIANPTMSRDEPVLAARAGNRGRVVLVGGGPGADDLITVRGLRELARADVVVADRLAPVGLVQDLPASVEVIDVGKSPYHHPVPQEEINQLLIDRARQGQYVVRLKGGDPFVLGRGGEEILACRAAGVDVQMVPGVTSALSAPAAADIPVTHRGSATGFLVISGHDDLEPATLASWSGTILVLMGMSRLPELAAGLQRNGRPATTPAAVVYRAWTPRQRVVRGTLADIASRVQQAGVRNPAVIVVGDVATVLAEG